MSRNIDLQKVTALAKRRGFVYPSSEIYGGLANTYDFGPYGTEMKENIRKLWWERFIRSREDMYGIDSSIIMNPKVWEASGHTESFADVMVEDKVNHKRYRADHLIEEHYAKKGEEIKVDGKTPEELAAIITEESLKSPDGNELSEPRRFNQLFETEIGIIAGAKNKAYLRGEIAQGLFINFKNIMDSMHPKLPFGIGQIGKAFRNEITQGKFTHRTLEFDLMEFEYFFNPAEKEWAELFEYWKKAIYDFALSLGISPDNLRWRPHEEFELAHYSKRTEDLEYNYPWGFEEMFACAYRTDFDLGNHERHTGKDMKYTYPDGKKVVPHVIEPTFGLSRLITVLLIDAYREEEVNGQVRTVLKLNHRVAPVKVAIFPLLKKTELEEVARGIHATLQKSINGWVVYDNTGNIGKNYRRQDEIGTPFCVTVDPESLEDKAVTIRDRDTMKQVRIAIAELPNYFAEHLKLTD